MSYSDRVPPHVQDKAKTRQDKTSKGLADLQCLRLLLISDFSDQVTAGLNSIRDVIDSAYFRCSNECGFLGFHRPPDIQFFGLANISELVWVELTKLPHHFKAILK